ncbi:MAG: respiratory nitrate reductase subunit gamma [Candidatus Thiodiazotropha sp. (ex Lucina aurantia)]|uniref:Nitrate reductase gamma subunit n=2 Tax=Candidatus Thiodiazotropha TaxID=1913444 RepID=A0A7Z1AEU2_9GAMM|nr:respiratory nitrate reductase subunit gamma [Candidatus Thiodiazotropha endolucinida]MBT3010353.1 respiratory nitrate reductase subunit gamma [Candidatus Thiodiazotropha sp. (ex Lucina pensylvanica)]MBT3014271.1 respiratory nitrate reductase subunit gamma [Candidatus Thiodiazotropha taylori]MBT3037969.1 respiratory nitrate reductase subunit gamma [Candidatus Thiodiazotropha sp. (ex Codakia orbicularis)]MBV2102432.1 respiratory nitrate reductase subunit gamma [Candidatus Thiodiazotropha sp. (
MSFAYALLFIVATLVLVLGLARKIVQYARTPAPLKIPTTPAPVNQTGVVLRMFREVVFFESLFKSTKWTWVFSWMFHMGLFLVLARHVRYFIDPVWLPIQLIQPFGKYAAFAMIAGLAGLLIRRIFVDRVRYISSPSDFLWLLLLIFIGLSGATMTFLIHTDVVAVKQFFTGFWTFSGGDLPMDPVLLVHLTLVAVLMLLLPFSKLLHIPGVFFSPTRNQVDNPREKRHLVDWARKLEES